MKIVAVYDVEQEEWCEEKGSKFKMNTINLRFY